jgi:hypothetical protein
MSDATETSRTGTLLLVGLGLVAVVALVAFVIVPLLTGDDGEDLTADDIDVVVDDTVIDDQDVAQDDVVVDEEITEEPPAEPPAETFEVFNARDPFSQLVDEDAGGGDTGNGTTAPPGTGGGTTTPPTTTPPGTTNGSTTPPPDTSGGTNGSTDGTNGSTGGTNGSTGDSNGSTTSGGSNGNGSDAQVGGTTVTLVDVFDDDGERQATVTVNGTGYTVGEGETFGRRFRLLDISGRCATMLFGDSRFTLCEGERIRK